MKQTAALPDPTALTFNGCIGWLHMPRSGTAMDCGVVLCNDFGGSSVHLTRKWRDFAVVLAEAGFCTLRFDYPNTGDSTDCSGPMLDTWRACIVAACDRLRADTGVEKIALAGLRLGALLAAQIAASRSVDVKYLLMLAPVMSGKQHVREVKLLAKLLGTQDPVSKDPEVAGLRLEPEDAKEIEAFDLTAALLESGADSVLVMEPPAQPRPSKFPIAALTGATTHIELSAFVDYEILMRPAHHSVMPATSFTHVAQWLAKVSHIQSDITAPARLPVILALPGMISETAVTFGKDAGLFGIFTSPAVAMNAPAILILNTGIDAHAGVSRLAVVAARRLAKRGFASLRIDVTGLGDSARKAIEPDKAGYDEMQLTSVRAHRREFLPDVEAAIDELGRWGFDRCVIVGVCAGANLGFHAALLDERVAGLVMANTTLVERFGSNKKTASSGDIAERGRVRTAIQSVLPKNFRIWLGHKNLWLKQMTKGTSKGLKAFFGRDTISPFVTGFNKLAEQGIKLLVIFSEGDQNLAKWMETFKSPPPGTSRLHQPLIMNGSSHSFEPVAMRDDLINTILSFMVTNFDADDAPSGSRPSVTALGDIFPTQSFAGAVARLSVQQ